MKTIAFWAVFLCLGLAVSFGMDAIFNADSIGACDQPVHCETVSGPGPGNGH